MSLRERLTPFARALAWLSASMTRSTTRGRGFTSQSTACKLARSYGNDGRSPQSARHGRRTDGCFRFKTWPHAVNLGARDDWFRLRVSHAPVPCYLSKRYCIEATAHDLCSYLFVSHRSRSTPPTQRCPCRRKNTAPIPDRHAKQTGCTRKNRTYAGQRRYQVTQILPSGSPREKETA